MAQVSVINRRDLEGPNRLDAEYYQPFYKQAIDKIRSLRQYAPVADFGQVLRGKTPSSYIENGVPVVRAVDLRDISNTDNLLAASPEEDLFLLQRGDVLISSIGAGSIGKIGVFDGSFKCATVSEVSVIRTNRMVAEALGAFFQTKYGYLQLEQRITGSTGQLHLYPRDIRNILVPLFDLNTQKAIGLAYRQSSQSLIDSRRLYAQAQKAVLDEVDFYEPTISKQLFYETTAREARSMDRLDAEYYRPVYRAADTKVKSIGSQAIELGELCETLTNGHTPLRHPLDEGDVAFLTAEHVHDFRLDLNSDKRILAAHHQGELKRTALKPGDILVTIKGKTGNAVVVGNLPGPTNINQDVALIRLKPGVSPDYFCAFLNSPLGKLLSARMATNQINPFLGLGNISKIPVPLLAESKMDKIGAGVRDVLTKAQEAEGKAKSLIEEAKRLVEQFIESAG